ncbi:hypothetical protein PO002_43500 [Cupriavidus necator]|uniref:hypothetical protein n=1 Tax=Cupriavidus necator TaxID=106590 RepID=UPI0039C35D6C
MDQRIVDNFTLARWRKLEAVVVLRAVAEYAKQDGQFRPRQSNGTTRWHANVGGVDYEILCTGPRFLDTRANRGGGGAVDLVMHLMRLDFKRAVVVLKAKQL